VSDFRDGDGVEASLAEEAPGGLGNSQSGLLFLALPEAHIR
jgi:hypothetical protein